MLRKMIVGAVAAVAIGFDGQTATAGDPYGARPVGDPRSAFFPPNGGFVPPQRVDYDYVVFVKRGGWFGYWERYGRFETRREAERVEQFLEARGFRARIEVVQDRRPRW